MGRANYHSLFTYKAGFSSLPISFSNLWELVVCYIGVFFLHRKRQTKKSQSYTSRFSQFKWEYPTPGSAPSSAVETPGLVSEAVMIPSRSWHSDAQDLLLLTLFAGGKSISGAKRVTDPWHWPSRALGIDHKWLGVDRDSAASEMPERAGRLQGRGMQEPEVCVALGILHRMDCWCHFGPPEGCQAWRLQEGDKELLPTAAGTHMHTESCHPSPSLTTQVVNVERRFL